LALTAITLDAQEQKLDGGLATLEAKKKPERTERIIPAGARSLKEFYDRCTACQLCVANCPNHVLRPSTDLEHLMQPESSYENGYCRPECVQCAEVCPAGAIRPITVEEKTAIKIGTATVDYDLCVVNRDGVSCGNCARHCPAEAITMVPRDPDDPHSLRTPAVIEDKCIGCGACEYLCPSRPYSAIHVNGLKVHIHG
jgi:ferredoxin